jgi:enolase
VFDQRVLDELLLEMDGTETKSNLGGATTSTLPVPFFDLIEGGELAGGALPFQEHQVVPIGAESVSEAVRMVTEVYYELGDFVEAEYGEASRNVGDEGGYNPIGLTDTRDAFDLELQAIERLGYGEAFALAADVAATHFYDPDADRYSMMGKSMTRDELLGFYKELVDAYPIVSFEDPLQENDFEGFAELTDRLDIQIIGDDLFVTNLDRIRDGIAHDAANSLSLNMNQTGTVTEACDTAQLAARNGYSIRVSERSGQTADTWLADLAVGLDAGQIKTGVTRSERTEQYNRLLEIEAELRQGGIYGADSSQDLSFDSGGDT